MYKLSILIILSFYFTYLYPQTSLRPFPQHTVYAKGSITPNFSPAYKDSCVCQFYNAWKAKYVKHGIDGQLYVFSRSSRSKIKDQCVSEGQGYGMVIVAFMAGYDPSAQKTYDSLYFYYKSHPSARSPYLMAWAQKKNFKDKEGSSATDGDMDIAFSLLLANAQWGSIGAINYFNEAKKMISAIATQEIDLRHFSILKSNADEHDSNDSFDIRPSDFMPSHLRAFEKISKDSIWGNVITNNLQLFDSLQNKFGDKGLLPDFIRDIYINAKPAQKYYEEGLHDGDYHYNACRIPWRIALDYILYQEETSKKIVEKINNWISDFTTTQGNPLNISSGYTLKGKPYSKQSEEKDFDSMSFMAPFAVSAMVDSKNQVWLDSLWKCIVHFNLEKFDYYENTIKMLNLIILSGNYWAP